MDIKELLAPKGLRAKPNTSPNQRLRAGKAKNVSTPGISIIIPAHNEQAYLKRTLAAINRQKYPECEVIVVANGCTDQTADVARQHCDRLVVLSQKGLGVARNLGARMARGDLLIFLDADTLLERDGLKTIAERFSPDYAAGTLKGQPDTRRLAYRMMYFFKNLTHRFMIHPGSSGVIICWRKQFMRLGGFDENLEVRENSHLIKRLKRFGGYKYIGQTTATTSMRRYDRRGFWRMIWMWIRLWFEGLFSDLRHREYEIVR
jgi:glycosyltransferase involved in cell wall biosynthesis